MRIVLIELSPSYRLALRRWLESRGHEVIIDLESEPCALASRADIILCDTDSLGKQRDGEFRKSGAKLLHVPQLESAEHGHTIDFATLERSLSSIDLPDQSLAVELNLACDALPPTLVAKSEEMHDVLNRIQRLSRVDLPILIRGETGTGKEVVAKALHEMGPRASHPFVAVHCGAIPGELLESILFGHERGSFTDAVRRHHGHLEAAGEGTILLDEIGEMPLRLQAKLLRVLQQRSFHRVGGNVEIQLRARVLAATNRNLSVESENGRFRQDLLYRIAGAILVVPPLRSRRADIAGLSEQLLDSIARATGVQIAGMTREGLQLLEEQAWPGNVRQLQNVLQRAVVLHDSTVLDAEHLRQHLDQPGSGPGAGDLLDAAISSWIVQARRTGWDDDALRREFRRRLETALHASSDPEQESAHPRQDDAKKKREQEE